MVVGCCLAGTAVPVVLGSNIVDLEIEVAGFRTRQHYKLVVVLAERLHKCMLADRMLAVEDGTLRPRATIHNRA